MMRWLSRSPGERLDRVLFGLWDGFLVGPRSSTEKMPIGDLPVVAGAVVRVMTLLHLPDGWTDRQAYLQAASALAEALAEVRERKPRLFTEVQEQLRLRSMAEALREVPFQLLIDTAFRGEYADVMATLDMVTRRRRSGRGDQVALQAGRILLKRLMDTALLEALAR